MSDDGVHWGETIQVFPSHTAMAPGRENAIHPTLVIESSTKSVLRGSLIYGYTPKWPDVPHHMARRTIVVSRPAKPPVAEARPREKIPEDAVAFANHHYKVFWERKTWTEAKEACTQKGGHLACAGTDERKAFLAGLKGKDKVVWVGAQRVDSGTWRWLDGTAFDSSELGRRSPPQCDYVAIHKKGIYHSRPVGGHDDRYPVKDVEGYICEWDQ